jgi:hypothetical protein
MPSLVSKSNEVRFNIWGYLEVKNTDKAKSQCDEKWHVWNPGLKKQDLDLLPQYIQTRCVFCHHSCNGINVSK